MEYYKDRLEGVLRSLNGARRVGRRPVTGLLRKEIGYGERETVLSDTRDWVPFGTYETWGGREVHTCFQALFTVPEEWEGRKLVMLLQTGATDIWNTDNPQFLVYVNGSMLCGHDMNHHEVILTEQAKAGEVFDYRLYAYSNSVGQDNFLLLEAAVVAEDVEELYYDFRVPFEIASLLKKDDLRQTEYFKKLNAAANLLDFREPGSVAFHRSVAEADAFLKHCFYEETEDAPIVVHSIGHTHIDVAWKWRLRQTREKVLRSFATVLYEMEHYPEYRFMSSQPQLYQFVKEEAPELFERIKERVAEGRWEPEGAMWLEADCNLSSGESLIRQILYGKQFFREEFGKGDNKVLWLPDVFGYSAAMPQILKKSGIRYFMTTKIGWNEYNQIPNDTMLWKGIDGTEILTYFITTKDYITNPELNTKRTAETTYNGRQNPNQIMGTWQRYQNKEINREVLTCFGHGDGGGGATVEMLELSRRMEHSLPGCPKVKQTFVREFFEGLEQRLAKERIPKWTGELYLEFHRGTYTSMARNKKYNRKSEFRNQDAESLAAICFLEHPKTAYPRAELRRAWELTLLNQFHDILPGSSIREVYEDSREQYEEVATIGEKVIEQALSDLSDRTRTSYVTLYNMTSFDRADVVETEGYVRVFAGEKELACQYIEGHTIWQPEEVPAKGFRVFRTEKIQKPELMPERQAEYRMETPYYRVVFNKAWEIASLVDVRSGRELIASEISKDIASGDLHGVPAGNMLQVFEDRPKEYDCWNIDPYYVEKSWRLSEVSKAVITEDGPVRRVLHVEREFLSSKIWQDIVWYQNSPRIDFKTTIDWKESQLLLKAAFPLDIIAQKATYEIQYGNVERPTHRNTSWDQAKFEVCAHKWADLSETGYGAALLNDCKYGYDIQENLMRLTLLKSGIFPNPVADQEHHEFTYSLYPHEGSFREGGVIAQAYLLNCPMYAVPFAAEQGVEKKSYFRVMPEHVILETVKLAEEGEDLILRFYEAHGKRTKATVQLAFPVSQAWDCDLLEQKEAELPLAGEVLTFPIKPYEIKTIRLKR